MKALFVNIFGGIVNTATIASGLVKVFQNTQIDVPMVVRLEGKIKTHSIDQNKFHRLRLIHQM